MTTEEALDFLDELTIREMKAAIDFLVIKGKDRGLDSAMVRSVVMSLVVEAAKLYLPSEYQREREVATCQRQIEESIRKHFGEAS